MLNAFAFFRLQAQSSSEHDNAYDETEKEILLIMTKTLETQSIKGCFALL